MSDRPPSEIAFTNTLKDLRTSASMTQAQLAAKMSARGFKWHAATVYKVENGERQVQLAEAIEIARIFDTPLERMAEHNSQDVLSLREEFRWLKHYREGILRDLDSMYNAAESLAVQLAKDGMRQKLSGDEYEEIFNAASPQVIDGIFRAWHELNNAGESRNCVNCGQPLSDPNAECEHCGKPPLSQRSRTLMDSAQQNGEGQGIER